MTAAHALRKDYYEALRRLTLQLSGMQLRADQDYFIDSRLKAIARREGFSNHDEMVKDLFARGEARLAAQVVSSLLERETRFFHHRSMFDALETDVFPSLYSIHKDHKIRILNAACGAGHETYSIAMSYGAWAETRPGMAAEIVGADYPSAALELARKGEFSHFDVQRGLPVRNLVTHFERRGDKWAVKSDMRRALAFIDYHLLSAPGDIGAFDIVYCRDALPRFAAASRERALGHLSKLVKPGGFLLLGPDESADTAAFDFKPIISQRGLFQKSAE